MGVKYIILRNFFILKKRFFILFFLFAWIDPGYFFKDPVEMSQVGESDFPADTGNIIVGLQHESLRMENPGCIQILYDGFSRCIFKFMTQMIGTDIEHLG